MKIGKMAALGASLVTLIGLAAVTGAPADAQGWHHGYQRWHHGHPGWHHGGYFHRDPEAAAEWYPGWRPGPGYIRHSWAWYESRPRWWRRAHPYYGTPGLSIWIKL
jgi:hypothetical protein